MKICLITGATSGIGLATASALAGFGWQLVLVGRNEYKCQKTVEALKTASGNSAMSYLLADLSSQQEVRQLAQVFQERFARLDVLINNAGGYFFKHRKTVDGLERSFALNHLAYFLLTNLLLKPLEASPAARVINVASGAHAWGRIRFDDLQSEKQFDKHQVYAQSKLANLLFSYELARRLVGTNVTVNAMNPGGVATNLGRSNSELRFWLRRLIRREKSPEAGARTVVYLATSDEVTGVTGKYFQNEQAIPSSAASYDEESARRLWDVSVALCGLDKPG
jgi:NAD(P)-dependent dehydrogenase (short-subunit alcohol dehydrogenase family)